jgi:hypothetical protein
VASMRARSGQSSGLRIACPSTASPRANGKSVASTERCVLVNSSSSAAVSAGENVWTKRTPRAGGGSEEEHAATTASAQIGTGRRTGTGR